MHGNMNVKLLHNGLLYNPQQKNFSNMVFSYLTFLRTPSYQYQHIIVTKTDNHALFKPLAHMTVITPLLL
jgi:hypothetical protein